MIDDVINAASAAGDDKEGWKRGKREMVEGRELEGEMEIPFGPRAALTTHAPSLPRAHECTT